MTSGQFESVPLETIWVDRKKRQRRDLGDITELAQSIQTVGLIEPPVIRRDGELVVGERRWTACASLGWTSIPIQWIDELDEVQLHLVEFEENIRRTDLPWQDEVEAVRQYHLLKQSIDPNWNEVATAIALNMGQQTTNTKIAVAEAIAAGNERVANAPVYSTARGIVERDNARKRSSTLQSISFDTPKTEEQAIETPPPKPIPPLLNVDFHEWAIEYDGPQFNFLHCDFPYGVGMDKSDQGAGDGHGTYADSADVYWTLVERLDQCTRRLIADSAHIMFWFSMDYYTQTKLALEVMGWKINPFPLIWYKSDNTGILPDPKRGPRRIYETAFFGSRGDRMIVNSVSNVFAFSGQGKTLHMNEKPVPMLKHFMRMFVDEYSLVLDPTAGSANALKAATALRANHVLGLERDPEFFNRSIEGYYNDEL